MRSRRERQGDTFTFVLTVINAYMLGLLLLALIFTVLAPAVVAVVGSGFSAEERPLVVNMLRLISPSLTLLGVAGVLSSLLQSENRFFFAQVAQVFLSLGIVAAALFAVPTFGIEGLPLGILAGAAVQVLWTWYWLRRGGLRYRFVIDIHDERFKRFMSLLGPGLVGALLIYLIPVIDKALATYLTEGGIASLSFGSRPTGFLARIGISAVAIAALPVFTAKALDDDGFAHRKSIERTLSIAVFTMLPASFLLATLRVPVIEVLYERGAFGAASVDQTAGVFAAAVLGLVPLAIATIVSTAFKSVEDTKTPSYYGASTNLVVKATTGPLLMIPFGVAGLAFSSTLMFTASGALLLVLFNRRVADIRLNYFGRGLLRALVASGAAALVVAMMVRYLDLSSLAGVTLGLAVGGVVYLTLSALMRSPEISYFRDKLVGMRAGRR